MQLRLHQTTMPCLDTHAVLEGGIMTVEADKQCIQDGQGTQTYI